MTLDELVANWNVFQAIAFACVVWLTLWAVVRVIGHVALMLS